MMLKRTIWVSIAILAVSFSAYAIVQYFILGANKSGLVLSKINFGEILNQNWYGMLYIHAVSSLIALAIGLSLFSPSKEWKS